MIELSIMASKELFKIQKSNRKVLTKTLLKKVLLSLYTIGEKLRNLKVCSLDTMLKLLLPSSIGIEEVDETGKTFEENALLKAKSILEGLISLSDDSGLCIKALKDEPGILSARFARNCGGWYEAMRKLYEKIKINNLNSTEAKFVSVIALRWEDSSLSIFRGEVSGFIFGLQEEKTVLVMILFLFHRVTKKLWSDES